MANGRVSVTYDQQFFFFRGSTKFKERRKKSVFKDDLKKDLYHTFASVLFRCTCALNKHL